MPAEQRYVNALLEAQGIHHELQHDIVFVEQALPARRCLQVGLGMAGFPATLYMAVMGIAELAVGAGTDAEIVAEPPVI